jgi:hypothetical protein
MSPDSLRGDGDGEIPPPRDGDGGSTLDGEFPVAILNTDPCHPKGINNNYSRDQET